MREIGWMSQGMKQGEWEKKVSNRKAFTAHLPTSSVDDVNRTALELLYAWLQDLRSRKQPTSLLNSDRDHPRTSQWEEAWIA